MQLPDINTFKDGQHRKLLLHTCCAPCAAGVLDDLVDHYDLTLFYYNPNILPEKEYNLRLENLHKLIKAYRGINIIIPEYKPDDFWSFAKDKMDIPEGGSRCTSCFSLRLTETAKYLIESNKYFAFATTLTLSPHKNATLINSIGHTIADKFKTPYLASDFKKNDGVLKSIRKCKELDIYRQKYCGCTPLD